MKEVNKFTYENIFYPQDYILQCTLDYDELECSDFGCGRRYKFTYHKGDSFYEYKLGLITILNIYEKKGAHGCLIQKKGGEIEWVENAFFVREKEKEKIEKTLDQIEQELGYKVKIVNNGKK